MPKETIGEYNVLFRNSDKVIVGDLKKAMGFTSVLGINEGSSVHANAIRKLCEQMNWGSFYSGESDWVLWDRDVWKASGRQKMWTISPSAASLGLPFKYSPARRMIRRPLKHVKSGDIHGFFVTHIVQGYAKPEGAFSDKFEAYKDLAAKAGILRVDNITQRWIDNPYTAKFDHLLGDMNVRQGNKQEPWYPANVWADQWKPDTLPGSIDWMMHSRRSERNGLRVVKRYTLGATAGFDSDHRFNAKTVSW